jgi:hypothetical protein
MRCDLRIIGSDDVAEKWTKICEVSNVSARHSKLFMDGARVHQDFFEFSRPVEPGKKEKKLVRGISSEFNNN